MKAKAIIFTISIILITVFSCKKEADLPSDGNMIEIGQTIIDSVGYFTTQVTSALTKTGGNQIIQHGHCWSTTSKPTTDDTKTTFGKLDGPTEYSSQLTNLVDNTTYYIRSYVTYSHGTVYGTEENIKTLQTGKPTVSTLGLTDIMPYSANCSGDVLSDGGLFVTAKGVCWDTTDNPTLENNIGFTIDDSGTGSISTQLTGLTEENTYYAAAYATNEKGTAYGQVKSFLTTNVFTDPRDGQTYATVIIGSQTWFAENLNYEMSYSWCYDNNSNNCDEYGRLYPRVTATTACPPGWHLPSDNEWTVLISFLGGENIAGDKMKETGTNHWGSSNTGATNSSGFTALPGGYSFGGGSDFRDLDSNGFWWSSSEYSFLDSWARTLSSYSGKVHKYAFGIESFSVRCIKD